MVPFVAEGHEAAALGGGGGADGFGVFGEGSPAAVFVVVVVFADLGLGAAQLQLVAVPHELRGLGARAGRRRRERRAQRLDAREPHLAVDRAVVLEIGSSDAAGAASALAPPACRARRANAVNEDQVAIGKARPAAVGSASAAASVTVPRMPHQPTTAAPRGESATASSGPACRRRAGGSATG